MESHVKSRTIRGFGKNSLRKGKCLFKFVHPLTQCLLLSMTFSNIHRQYGYFSNDKINSSLQLFITRTRELPGDAVMGGESTPQREGNGCLMPATHQPERLKSHFPNLVFVFVTPPI